MITLTTAEQQAYCDAANALKGSARRKYMAGVVQALGRGGQRYVERTFGWNRRTVRKGLAELTSGVCHTEQFAARGRRRIEERLPHLLTDLRAIVDEERQSAASPSGERVVIGLSAGDVRNRLIETKGYAPDTVPSLSTIRSKLSELGYQLRPPRNFSPSRPV